MRTLINQHLGLSFTKKGNQVVVESEKYNSDPNYQKPRETYLQQAINKISKKQ